jgi:hypothetical protein
MMRKTTVDQQIALLLALKTVIALQWKDEIDIDGILNNLDQSVASLQRLKGIESAQVPEEVDVGEMIFVWSMRPKPDTATGAAWEQGARQGWAWRQEHIDTLRDLLRRETASVDRLRQMRLDEEDLTRKYHADKRAAEAKLAEASKDAERLDWLEAHDGRFYNIDKISAIVGSGFSSGGRIVGKSLRSAIDSVIEENIDG